MSIEFIQIVGSLLGAVLTFFPFHVRSVMLRITPEPLDWWYKGQRAIFGLVGFGIVLLVKFFVLPIGQIWFPLG